MKINNVFFLFVLFVTIVGQSGAQPIEVPLAQTWVGPDGQYLDVGKDTLKYYAHGGNKYGFGLRDTVLTVFSDETLSFVVQHPDANKLLLIPKDSRSQNFLTGQAVVRPNTPVALQPMEFVSRNSLYAAPFSFQRLLYSRSGCGMIRCSYPNIGFDIDSNGNMKLSCVSGKGKLNGTYTGKLSPVQLVQLVTLVKNSVPDRFAFDKRHWEDAPGEYFNFYYNNKKNSSGGSSPPPYLAWALTDYLYSLLDIVPLQQLSEKYEYFR